MYFASKIPLIACGISSISPLSFAFMASENHRQTFADRLRDLRNRADVTIEEASDQGGVSSNFWGQVERNEQEPCLDVIMGFATGLGIPASVLFDFQDQRSQDETRRNLNTLLDLCNPKEIQLIHQIAHSIYKSNREDAL